MTWEESVLRTLDKLPTTFTSGQIYAFVPSFRKEFPRNKHVKEKIRQTLQRLREKNLVQFSDRRGIYIKAQPSWPFHVNQLLTRDDLVTLFNYRGRARFDRGMARPAPNHPLRQHMVIFHNETHNPYDDVVEPGRIIYVGEGKKGNQRLTVHNKFLANHRRDGLHVHYFVQPKEHPGKIRYEGEVWLEEYRYVFRPNGRSKGRSVYEFVLRKTATDPLKTLQSERADMEQDVRPPGYENRRRVLSAQSRIWRDPAFRDLVLAAYAEQCAVCGRTHSKRPLLDLQAAHIVGVHERGRDVISNGIALCARHHWCFDHGLFSISNDYRILWQAPEEDHYGELKTGQKLRLPQAKKDRPDPFYLTHHRKKWAATL